jgi:hypothetical protein
MPDGRQPGPGGWHRIQLVGAVIAGGIRLAGRGVAETWRGLRQPALLTRRRRVYDLVVFGLGHSLIVVGDAESESPPLRGPPVRDR